MSQHRLPLYRHTDQIYGTEDGAYVLLPLAVVEKVRQTEKARLLRNVATGAETWFPESVFSYHWHCVSVEEMVLFLSIPGKWVKDKAEFFQ